MVTKQRAPTRVDCSYLITAWASESISNPSQDEHRILGEVMRVLLRHATLPAQVLQGDLAGPGAAPARQHLAARPPAEPGRVLAGPGRQAEGGSELHGDDRRNCRRGSGDRAACDRQADPRPKEDCLMTPWMKVEPTRHQVAIAGQVADAQTGRAIGGAKVRITQAPPGFVDRLVVLARLAPSDGCDFRCAGCQRYAG